MSRKLTPRQVIARSYPTWDYALADRLIAWLDDCGYQIVEKSVPHRESSLVPTTEEFDQPLESSHQSVSKRWYALAMSSSA